MVVDYFKFLVKSKNEHSLHSPFLFDFYTKVVKDKTKYQDYEVVEKLIKRLLQDDSVVERAAFVTENQTDKSNHQKIKNIAQKASKKLHLAKFTYRIIKYFDYKDIVNFGKSIGLTATLEALAAQDGDLISFEEYPQIAQKNLNDLGISNAEIIDGNSDSLFLEKIQEINNIDFAFFDTNNRLRPTIEYFKICTEKAHEESCFVINGIYQSDEMKQAWSEIKNSPPVTLSIDFFWIGVVFFRRKQPKQHFTLRL